MADQKAFIVFSYNMQARDKKGGIQSAYSDPDLKFRHTFVLNTNRPALVSLKLVLPLAGETSETSGK